MSNQPINEFDPSDKENKANVVPFSKKSSYINQQHSEDYLRSGKCNDPRLKGVIQRIQSGEEVLTISRAKKLVDAHSKAANNIYNSVTVLSETIERLKNYEEPSQSNNGISLKNLEDELNNGLKLLTDPLEQVLNIALKHGYPPANRKEDCQEFKEYVQELRYFHRFFANQAHVSTMRHEKSPFSQAYFRRIDAYLGYLPNACRFLVNATRQTIADKIPGHQSDEIIL